MKLLIDEALVTNDVTLKDIDALDWQHNVDLRESDGSFLKWVAGDSGARIEFFTGTGEAQQVEVDIDGDFDVQLLTTAFKSFYVQDEQWLNKFEWSSLSLDDSDDEDDDSDDEEKWQSWDVMIDDQTPAVILCNTSVSDLIEQFTDQFVMFGLKLELPDDNGLATPEEQEFCEAVETEIVNFVSQHEGVAVGEITSDGIRKYYTYNNAPEEDIAEFLGQIENQFGCSLTCEIEEDVNKKRYWSDLHPEEHLEEDDFADEVDE